MKYLMYVVMASLTVIAVILAIMINNKPEKDEEPTTVVEETNVRERDTIFPTNPTGEEDDEFTIDILVDPVDDEEEDEDSDIMAMDVTMYTTTVVNVRAGNNQLFDLLGQLANGQAVHVIGQSRETEWYLIEYGEGEGFVSNSYLSENAQATTPTPPPEDDQPANTSGENDG